MCLMNVKLLRACANLYASTNLEKNLARECSPKYLLCSFSESDSEAKSTADAEKEGDENDWVKLKVEPSSSPSTPAPLSARETEGRCVRCDMDARTGMS